MCGVIGFVGKTPIAERLVTASDRLQNRGEHSTGVATYDGKFFYSKIGLGPAPVVFQGFDLKNLRGNAGIAHTRYATTGGDTSEMLLRNAQPVYADRPGMFTCANGDMINVVPLTDKLRSVGFSFQTEVDSKVIQDLLLQHLIEDGVHKAHGTNEYVEKLFDAVKKLHSEIQGAYSTVCLMETGFLAFKDQHGIRPLCMASRLDQSGKVVEYAFSSESTVFNYFGDYHNIEEVGPGEAIFIEYDTLKVHRKRVSVDREAFCFFEFIYFSRPDTKYHDCVVEAARKSLGGILADEYRHMRDKFDVVIGVPGTGLSAAHEFSQKIGVKYENAIIKVSSKRSFQESSDEKRHKAIDDKFIFIKEFVDGKRVAVIDDSNVRGTTARKIGNRLYNLGAKEVHFFFFSPPIIGSCFYGIDTPDETKLVAVGRDSKEIAKIMKVESVNYISRPGLIKGLGIPENELCLACICKDYPTPVEEIKRRLELRNKERTRC